MAKDSVIKTVIRSTIREELKATEESLMVKVEQAFSEFQKEMFKAFREMREEFTTMKLEILGELKTTRQEQTMLNARSAKINKIEDEVESLKKIHPKFSHAAI